MNFIAICSIIFLTMDDAFYQLNEEQIKPVMDINGRVLVVAGAGSGKTRVLTARIAYLLQMGVDPQNILAITFTNKAAEEMKDRISKSSDLGQFITACTFHSLCARILRVYGNVLGYDKNFTIFDEEDRGRAVKKVLEYMPGYDKKDKDFYLEHISKAKNYCLSPAQYYEETKYEVTEALSIREVYETYEKELKFNNALDFDDLLIKCYELLSQHYEVLSILQERCHYIHVDEFQDTNEIQFKLVSLLSQKYGNLFVVGDEDQSIYGWRGSKISHIVDFKKYFSDAKVYKLEQNYRSTPEILDLANNVIKHNAYRNEKVLWTKNPSDKESVKFKRNEGDREEADFVSSQIMRLQKMGVPFRQMAILIRITALSRIFEEKLTLYGIPYKVFGGYRFYERKEVKDALAYVRMTINPKDSDSIVRIINYPRRGIGEKTIEHLIELALDNNLTLYDTIINIDKIEPALKPKLQSFIDVMLDLQLVESNSDPKEFIEHMIKVSGLERTLSESKDIEDEARLENIKELVNAVDEFLKDNPNATLADYIQSSALLSAADAFTDDEYVSIATVHAVKGLEFDTVFICGCEDELFPLKRIIDGGDPAEMEEERRLMYVAITRAKRQLFVSYAANRFRRTASFTGVYRTKISRFVVEMNPTFDQLNGDRPKSNWNGSLSGNAWNNSQNTYVQNSIYNRKGHGYSQQSTYGQQYNPKPQPKPVLKTEPKKDPVDVSKFKKNQIVEHKKFGRGIIMDIIGEGDSMVLKIAFKGLGVKQFSAVIAAPLLKIIEE